MTTHPRNQIVELTRAEIGLATSQLAQKHQLTHTELLGILGGEITSACKYALREERHLEQRKSNKSAVAQFGGK